MTIPSDVILSDEQVAIVVRDSKIAWAWSDQDIGEVERGQHRLDQLAASHAALRTQLLACQNEVKGLRNVYEGDKPLGGMRG